MSAADNQRDAPDDNKRAVLSLFAKRLRYWRQERGLSLKALAQKAGVGEMTIVAYEQNARTAGIDKVAALADALDVTVADLLDDNGVAGNLSFAKCEHFASLLGLHVLVVGTTQVMISKSKQESLVEFVVLDKADFMFKIEMLISYSLTTPRLRDLAKYAFFDGVEPD